ncbi:MAG: alkaline phosphatase D family protein [Hyphomonadaceae bacterium JAD_PAG50586_4]|nr:MAG: alkaline phosphatase D family protein [Hyphomonadaceae bacterium JAD_PAG50586_4]
MQADRRGLQPGARYFYRFIARGETSPVGRTRTLPEGNLDRLGIALVSCSNFAFGYFNAYDAIARDADVDFVLHTGDYIYEYGADGWGGEVGAALGRAHAPAHEIVTLADYRARQAQYKRDAGSLAMHAAHPLIVCWDDHESANNPWIGGAQNHQPETEGDWRTRREASVRAYYEWMPIREPGIGRGRNDLWRAYSFGDLASLVTLETRHTARGKQVNYTEYFERITSHEARNAFMRDVIGDPQRAMLSPAMERDLDAALRASVAQGQPWRLVGNASPMARMLVPDVAALGVDPRRMRGGETLGSRPDLFWTGRWNLPFYTDTWDGYPAAREKFYALCREAGARDLLVLTGDSHSFWMNTLADDSGNPMGLELGTAGVTSPGDFIESGWDEETARALDLLFAAQLPEVQWTDNMHQGYVKLLLTRAYADAAFIAVDTVLSTDYRTMRLRSARIERVRGVLAFNG